MGRDPSVCKQKLRKGLWSPEEDEKLSDHITKFGVGCWSTVPKQAGLQRCGKSCRLRWINYLRPDIKRGTFSQQEEDVIINLHRLLGNRWSQIASQLPGRTDNEIKNYWNSTLKKKLKMQGVDPRTHKPYKEDAAAAADEKRKLANDVPVAVNRRSRPIFDPFLLADPDPFLVPTDYLMDLQQHGLHVQHDLTKAFDGHHANSGSAADGDNNSCSNSNSNGTGTGNAVGVGPLEWGVERNMDDFLQLIHTDCSGIQEEEEQEISRLIMSGAGELDCESQMGFL